MPTETFIYEQISSKYGKDTADDVKKNIRIWQDRKSAEDTEYDTELRDNIYPYLALVEVLMNKKIDTEEIKSIVKELIQYAPLTTSR